MEMFSLGGRKEAREPEEGGSTVPADVVVFWYQSHPGYDPPQRAQLRWAASHYDFIKQKDILKIQRREAFFINMIEFFKEFIKVEFFVNPDWTPRPKTNRKEEKMAEALTARCVRPESEQ